MKNKFDPDKFMKLNTPEEEAAIQKAIDEDPDTWTISPDCVPLGRRGRPPGQTKTQVTLRIDNDVIAALKGDDPKGWHSRANAALRSAVIE